MNFNIEIPDHIIKNFSIARPNDSIEDLILRMLHGLNQQLENEVFIIEENKKFEERRK